jgi:F-type H+-transporting ATPase subunit delta
LGAATKINAGDQVVDQLRQFEQSVREHSVLREVFSSPRISHLEKTKVIDRLLGQRVHPVLLRFLKVAAQRGRLGFLTEISQAATEMRDEAMGRVVAAVRTATPLSDKLRIEVKESIGRLIGKEVVLRESVDPELLGGIVVRVGDTVYDSSIAGKLSRMSQGLRNGITSRLMSQSEKYFSGDVSPEPSST